MPYTNGKVDTRRDKERRGEIRGQNSPERPAAPSGRSRTEEAEAAGREEKKKRKAKRRAAPKDR